MDATVKKAPLGPPTHGGSAEYPGLTGWCTETAKCPLPHPYPDFDLAWPRPSTGCDC